MVSSWSALEIVETSNPRRSSAAFGKRARGVKAVVVGFFPAPHRPVRRTCRQRAGIRPRIAAYPADRIKIITSGISWRGVPTVEHDPRARVRAFCAPTPFGFIYTHYIIRQTRDRERTTNASALYLLPRHPVRTSRCVWIRSLESNFPLRARARIRITNGL